MFRDYTFKIATTSPRGQWVNPNYWCIIESLVVSELTFPNLAGHGIVMET